MSTEAATMFEAVVSTATPVLRRDGWRPDNTPGPWFEVLPPRNADLSRLAGGPVLLDHQYRSDLQVGVVETAAVRGEAIVAQLRFGSGPQARQIEKDVAERTRRQVSVGYSVEEWDRRDGKDEIPTFAATAWTPAEVSIVPLGADPMARFRADDSVSTQTLRYRNMTVSTSQPVEPAATATPDALVAARVAERERVSAILTSARALNVDVARVEHLLTADVPLDEARAQIIDLAAERQRGTEIRNHHVAHVTGGTDHANPDRIRERMSDALAHRLSGGRVALPEASREFAGASMLDMVRTLATARGHRGFISRVEAADMAIRGVGYHTTSDFPILVQNSAEKALLDRFATLPPALLPAVRRTEVADFKPILRARLGEGSALSKVIEHGEVTYGTLSDKGEIYQVGTYGNIFAFSRNLIVNDDLGGLQDFIANVGSKASTTLGDLLSGILTTNAAMSDGTALFHANHGNLGTAAAISTASIGAARQAMRLQTGPDGTVVDIVPTFLVVGPAKETEAETVLATIAANVASAVNVFAGKLTLIVEPRLTGNQWYLIGSPAQYPAIEYAELSGARPMSGPGPQVETRVGFNVLGLEVRVTYDVGAGAVAHQPIYKNPGA